MKKPTGKSLHKPFLLVLLIIGTIILAAWLHNVLSTPYHQLSVWVIATSITIVILLLIVSYKKQLYNTEGTHQEQIKYASILTEAWKSFFIVALVVHYALNILSVYCSIINAYIASTYPNDSSAIVLYSVLAITFLFVDLLVKPKEIGLGYRQAYEYALDALHRFLSSPSDTEWEKVLSAIKYGEEIIGKHVL